MKDLSKIADGDRGGGGHSKLGATSKFVIGFFNPLSRQCMTSIIDLVFIWNFSEGAPLPTKFKIQLTSCKLPVAVDEESFVLSQ